MDDNHQILKNPAVQSLSVNHLITIFSSPVNRIYAPLTSLSFALEYQVIQDQPFFYHLNNILLHIGISLSVYVLALHLGLPTFAASSAALLFGLHPIHVESVAWITERKGLLCALFYIFALISYLKYLKAKEDGTAHHWHYGGGLLCCLLSVLAKPVALSLPLVLCLLDWKQKRRKTPAALADKIPFLLIVAPIAWISFRLNTSNYSFEWFPALWLPSWSCVFQLRKFFLPVSFSIFYPFPEPASWQNPICLSSALILVGLIGVLWRWRSRPWMLFAFTFFLATIFFLIDFYPGPEILTPAADRFMYLPSLGFCLWLGHLSDLARKRWASGNRTKRGSLALAGFLILAILAVKTWTTSRLWADELTLLNHAVASHPSSFYAYRNRAALQGKMGRVREALADYDQAIALKPHWPQGYFNRGTLYRKMKNFDLALTDYTAAVRLDPKYADPYNNRAVIHAILGDSASALEDFNTYLRLRPEASRAYFNRALLHKRRGQYQRAVSDVTVFLTAHPETKKGYLLRGQCYLRLGMEQKAQLDFLQALALDPHDTEAKRALSERIKDPREKVSTPTDESGQKDSGQ